MKRNLKIVLLGIILLFALVIAIWYKIRIPDESRPNKLLNIPKNAIWKGAEDEGFWFEIISINSTQKTYRIKIYNDYNGELVVDADFIKQDSCKSELPLNKEIIKQIAYFEFNKIEMKNDCSLKIIKPVYGGTFLEQNK